MNSFLSLFISLVAFSIITVHLTSSASFPNPPQFPSPNASADEWTLFWKLLHNYYAIIARPRFGKRYNSMLSQSKHPSLLTILNPNFLSSSSYDNDLNYMLSENNHNANDDQKVDFDELYTFMPSNQKR
ncbi:unnamed protein product [Rotaria sordida]|uniref:Neuropeptide Y n=1 Tax=Rotaria sordida TaxID=392033 RepID=A0A814D5P6_9BILA|nr:unnamed protein product [Rotaria sordida]CAF0946134.1 unnamed protein product [Rotaria sordida]CAF0949770.1 unnamed protein product [Rotaria sordida]CAF3705378.1 unnamed protein product [Rotaria sordida]CAF4101986.1 unnamed protein product [Rotaria sordida]